MFYQEDRSMKNIRIKSKYFLFILLTCSACFDEYDATLDETFIYFESESLSIPEGNDSPLTITALLSGPLQPADVVINYTVTLGENTNDGDFEIEDSGSLIIPANKATASITLTPIDDDETGEDKQVTIAFASNSAEINFGFPGPAANNSVVEVTINEDDCVFEISEFVGAFDVEVTSASTFGVSATSLTYTTSLRLGDDPNTLIDPGFWERGEVIISIDPSTLEVTLPGQQFAYFNSSNLERSFIQGAKPPGLLSTCGLSFTVDAQLIRTSNSSVANEMLLVYTKR